MQRLDAPWTEEQVKNLNDFQHCGYFHPFTCGSGRRTDSDHKDGEGVLLATPAGWVCPFCDYKQTWCLDFMAEGRWRRSEKETVNLLKLTEWARSLGDNE